MVGGRKVSKSQRYPGKDRRCSHRIADRAVNNQYSNTEYVSSAEILFTLEYNTVPKMEVVVSYRINALGEIKVNVVYHGQKGVRELPLLGIRFIMPTQATSFTYEGLSGETYPDRMAGGVEGIYKITGLPVTPYLVPQDCGVHMKTKWVEITRDTTLSNVEKKRKNFLCDLNK